MSQMKKWPSRPASSESGLPHKTSPKDREIPFADESGRAFLSSGFSRRGFFKLSALAATLSELSLPAGAAEAPVAHPIADLGVSTLPVNGARLSVSLPPPLLPDKLLANSSFGINTGVFDPSVSNFPARLRLMQEAGIKWGRRDYIWSDIEKQKDQYDWSWNDRVADQCAKHGVLLFGNLAYNPPFHDPCTPEGVQAYCRFAREAVARYRGKLKHWQIWNEPNGGFWKGTPEEYARLLSAAGTTIHRADPDAKVLGLNMAFCDVL